MIEMSEISDDYKKLISQMQQKLKRRLDSRAISYNNSDIEDEIEDAIDAVNLRRGFVPTSLIPFETKYSQLIVKLALYSISKYGAEGETSHSENGISRSYDSASNYPEALMSTIIPLAKSSGDLQKI